MTKAKNLVWFNACKDLKVLDCECIHSCASQFAPSVGGGGGGGGGGILVQWGRKLDKYRKQFHGALCSWGVTHLIHGIILPSPVNCICVEFCAVQNGFVACSSASFGQELWFCIASKNIHTGERWGTCTEPVYVIMCLQRDAVGWPRLLVLIL